MIHMHTDVGIFAIQSSDVRNTCVIRVCATYIIQNICSICFMWEFQVVMHFMWKCQMVLFCSNDYLMRLSYLNTKKSYLNTKGHWDTIVTISGCSKCRPIEFAADITIIICWNVDCIFSAKHMECWKRKLNLDIVNAKRKPSKRGFSDGWINSMRPENTYRWQWNGSLLALVIVDLFLS